MSETEEEVISPDDMRKRLYQTFKNRGVLDNLKAQLRNQLVHELKHPALGSHRKPSPLLPEADSVMVTASNSLVLDHLQKAGFEYTISVFYSESGMVRDKVFSVRDLLQLLKISPQSALYNSLTSDVQNDNQKGFLMRLLTELMDNHMHQKRCDAGTQTVSTAQYRDSLVEKLQMIEDEYAGLRHQGNRWESLEAKLLESRKEIESHLQAEMDARLQHFKDVEVAKIKLEEKEKSRKEVLELRRDLERSYEKKLEGLISRERNAIERLRKQQEIEEQDIYKQRQSLLNEIEAVRNREAELRHRMEAFERTCRLQEEKAQSSEELLRRRELAVKTLEDTYEQRLKNELARYQLDLKEEYLKRTEKLTSDEKRMEAQATHLQKELASIEAKAEDHREALAALNQLKVELDMMASRSSLLTREKAVLEGKLGAMNDYQVLKMERTELLAQVRDAKRQAEELQEENRQLRLEVSRPSETQLALQVELRRVEAARKMEVEEFESQKQLLQLQLRAEVERCDQLKAQLSECQERAQWVATHAEEVKLQLQQTQLALENEVLRNPKPSLVDRSVLDVMSPDIYVNGLVGRSQDDRRDVGAIAQRRWHRRSCSGSLDPDTELLAGAKARIQELEKEAESLEEAYRSYQQRATCMAVARFQAPQAHSPQLDTHGSRPQTGPQPRVTFAQDEHLAASLFSGVVGARLLESLDFNEGQTAGEQTPPGSGSSPPRRLSSTPLSISKWQLPKDTAGDAQSCPLTFSGLSTARQLSPIPRVEPVSLADPAPDLSPPGSPCLRSTSRQPGSLADAQEISSSSGSSPHPEKIRLEDLTEPPQEPDNIPELLRDKPDHLSGEAPEGQGSIPLGAEQKPDCQSPDEKSQCEALEDKGRSQSPTQMLHKGGVSQELSTSGNGTAIQGGGVTVTSPTQDPLTKYMKMVMQGKEAEPNQHTGKDEPDGRNVESDSLSASKDDSIVAFSLDEADEDFW